MKIHTSYEFMLCWRNSLFVGAIIFVTFGAVNVTDSHVCLWTCTDAPQVLKRRSACSSPALLAAPFFDGISHCQDSWIAMSDVAWIHVSTWMQASLECMKANESVGHLRWTPWWLPLVVPDSLFETCFCKVIIVEALLSNNLFYLVRPTSWKHWPIRWIVVDHLLWERGGTRTQIVPVWAQHVW